MRPLIIFALLFLYACGDSETVSQIARQKNISEGTSENLKLRNAAFKFLKGKSQEEAIQFISDDGFMCNEVDCILKITSKNQVFGRLLGIAKSVEHSKSKTYVITYKIKIPSKTVEKPTDIYTNISLMEN